MQKLIKPFFILLLIFTIGCQNPDKGNLGTANQKHPFLLFLEETFNIQSTIEEELFIIIPCTGCYGCEHFIYTVFSDELLGAEGFTLIICDPASKGFLSPTLEAENIKYDFLGNMSDYEFGNGYPTCIIVNDGSVVKNFRLSPDIIHWMNKFLQTQKFHNDSLLDQSTNEPMN